MSGKNFSSLTSPVIFCTFFSFHQEQTLKNNSVCFKKAAALSNNIAVRESGTTVKVFLMPAGNNGCMVIKKEVVQ
ncbi:hypothetical protein ASZ90_008508 [hydrocarbon metagenome]|uniref:Uncharacterized protein n=1 Tax=hydrocarbon metagenome TaxID=938273 RepID=A0A0W8FLC2_9ZZZZ